MVDFMLLNKKVYENDQAIEHVAVHPIPLLIEPNMYATYQKIDSTDTVRVLLSPQGAGCYQWVHRGALEKSKADYYSYASFTQYFRNIQPDHAAKLLAHIRGLFDALKVAGKVVNAIYLHTYKNEVRGITRNYNVAHRGIDVYAEILKSKIRGLFSHYILDEFAERFYLRIKGDTFFVISNGYTGHEQLSYEIKTTFKAYGDHTYDHVQPHSSNKHLSRLGETFQAIVEATEEIQQKNLSLAFEEMSSSEFMDKIFRPAISKVRMMIEQYEVESLMGIETKFMRGDSQASLRKIPREKLEEVVADYEKALSELDLLASLGGNFDSVPMLVHTAFKNSVEGRNKVVFEKVTDFALSQMISYHGNRSKKS